MLIIMLHAWHLQVIQRRGSFSNKSLHRGDKTFWCKTTISASVLHGKKTMKKQQQKKQTNKQTNKQKKNKTPKYFPGGMKNNM